MSQSNRDRMVDILSTGLQNFATAGGDRELVDLGAMTLRQVSEGFVENVKSDDICTFAFPGIVILPGIRTDCFAAVLNDRVIVAWRKGVIKKTTVGRVIPKRTIKQVSWAVSKNPGTRGATVLTIVADETIDIVLPKGKPAVANAIVAAMQAA